MFGHNKAIGAHWRRSTLIAQYDFFIRGARQKKTLIFCLQSAYFEPDDWGPVFDDYRHKNCFSIVLFLPEPDTVVCAKTSSNNVYDHVVFDKLRVLR